MKHLVLALLLTGSVQASDLQHKGFYMPGNQAAQTEARKKEAAEANARYKKFVPADPWRSVKGAPAVYAKGTNWLQFTGTILNVHPDGIRIRGWYGVPEHWQVDSREYFIKNYPYPVADGDHISWKDNRCATPAGVYSYKATLGDRVTLHCLDYGTPAPIPQPLRTTSARKP